MPCRRARSAVFIPASPSFSTPMICSSENLLRFILVRPSEGRTLIPTGGNYPWQVTCARSPEPPAHPILFAGDPHDIRRSALQCRPVRTAAAICRPCARGHRGVGQLPCSAAPLHREEPSGIDLTKNAAQNGEFCRNKRPITGLPRTKPVHDSGAAWRQAVEPLAFGR